MGTGFDSKMKLVLKAFPVTKWIIQKCNINIFAWQIKRKKKKKMCVLGGGEGKGNEHGG